MTTRAVRRARTRLITYHSPAGYVDINYRAGGGTEAERVIWADEQTGKHDCRAALCIALGVPLDLIGPLGHGPDPGGWTPVAYEPIQAVGPDGTYFLEAS